MEGRVRRHRRVRTTLVAAVVVASLGVAAVVGVSRQAAVAAARRAEAARLVALARAEMDRYPTATLAYARKSLEVADNSDARRLAVASLWRSPTLRILPVGYGGARGAEFSPDGRWLAVYTVSENMQFFPEDGGPPRVVPGFNPAALEAHVSFTPSGDALVGHVGNEARVRMVSFPEGEEICWFESLDSSGEPQFLTDMAPSADGLLLGIPELDQPYERIELHPWDGGPSRVVGVVRGQPDWHFRAQGTRLAGFRGSRIFERPVSGGPSTPEVDIDEFPDRRLVCLRGMGRQRLVAGDREGRVTVWTLAGDEPRLIFDRQIRKPSGESSPRLDGTESLLTWNSAAEGAMYLWDLDSPPEEAPRVFRQPEPGDNQVFFHPRNDWLAGFSGKALSLWAIRQPWVRVIKSEGTANDLLFTSDSRWLVSCEDPGLRLKRLAASTGTTRSFRRSFRGLCTGAALSPDERDVVFGAGSVFRASLEDGNQDEMLRVRNFAEVLGAAAYNEKGDRAVTASVFCRPPTGKFLRLWDMPSGDLLRKISLVPEGEEGDEYKWGVVEVSFVSERQVLVAGWGGIRRFDLESGDAQTVWSTPLAGPTVMALTADKRQAIAAWRLRDLTQAEADGELLSPVIIDIETGERRPIATHGGRVTAVAIDPQGRIIATGEADGTVRVGSAEGTEPHLLLGHGKPISSLAFSPDRQWLASSAGDEIRLWPIPDLSKPPLHTLPHEELLAKLRTLTNLEAVEDEASGGYRLEIGPFPGWKDVPTW
jgi:WD40 repeat protein